MPTQRMTLGQWRRKLGDSVPLAMAPLILGVAPAQLRRAVSEGLVAVHTFHVEGKAYHRVRAADLQRFAALRRKPATLRDHLLTRPASIAAAAHTAVPAVPSAGRRVLLPRSPVRVEGATGE